jgi:hypothetical protein
MAFDLGSPVLSHDANDDAANHGRDDDPWSEMIHAGADERRIPAMVEEQVGKQADQLVQQEGDGPCDEANSRRKKRNEHDAKLRRLGLGDRRQRTCAVCSQGKQSSAACGNRGNGCAAAISRFF